MALVALEEILLCRSSADIDGGIKLAKRIGGRPGREDLLESYHARVFPSERSVRKNFGTLQNFHEIIGFPSVKGWQPEDYYDWGVAFKKQNGSHTPISNDALIELSGRGKGPSNNAIHNTFGGIPYFARQVDQKFSEVEVAEEQGEKQRLQAVTRAAETDKKLADTLADTSDDQLLKVAGQYSLVMNYLPTLPADDLKQIALRRSPDSVARNLVSRCSGLSIADIENMAVILESIHRP